MSRVNVRSVSRAVAHWKQPTIEMHFANQTAYTHETHANGETQDRTIRVGVIAALT